MKKLSALLMVLFLAACGEVEPLATAVEPDSGPDMEGAAGQGGSAGGGAAGSGMGGQGGGAACPEGQTFQLVDGAFKCVPTGGTGTAGSGGQATCDAAPVRVTVLLVDAATSAPVRFGDVGVGYAHFMFGRNDHRQPTSATATALTYEGAVSTTSPFGTDVSVQLWNGNQDKALTAPPVNVRPSCAGSAVTIEIRFTGWPN